MGRLRTALAAAVGGALLAPGAILAAGDEPAAAPAQGGASHSAEAPAPAAQLSASPRRPDAGAPVTLDASASRGSIVRYRWDLDGDGSFETDGGESPRAVARFAAGERHVAVQVVDRSGRTAAAATALTVAEPPRQAAPLQPASATARARSSRGAAPTARPRTRQATAHAAGSHSVVIQNFAFAPATISVTVGDTVTWTNRDSAPHTATASNGSFNTGTLKKGQSGSAAFSKPGRFAYICAIHPNMKGTVVVAGSGGGSSGGGGGSSGGGSSAGSSGGGSTAGGIAGSAGASPSGGGSGSLPRTGLEVLAIVLVGLALTASGAALRWLVGRVEARAARAG